MIDENLARSWLSAFAPPRIRVPSEFAESEIVLPASTNAIPGPLRLTPYQRGIVDAIGDDEVETIVLNCASQTGKSACVNAMLAYCIACAPGPMLHVSPTTDSGKEFVRERLDPLIASSPTLRALVGTGQDKRKGKSGGIDSLSSKTFPGGQLSFAGSYQPSDLNARSVRYLFLDEVDRFSPTAGTEGDPVQLAIKRTTLFAGKGRKVILVSTPTRRGSRINQWFLKGDRREFCVICPDCKHVASLEFESLKWDRGNPASAFLRCDECGAVHDEACRRKMIAGGEWIATASGEPGIRSFHLGELASEFSTLDRVARQAEDAKTPEEKQAFYNTTLARVYDAGTEVELSPSDLQQRAERIAPPYAANIRFVTAGVDVQPDRMECTYLAHHADETATVLNHLKIMGDTSAEPVWRELDAALDATFPLTDGRSLGLAITAIDSGFSTNRVYGFVAAQRRKSRRIVAVKGKGGFGREFLTQSKGRTPLLIAGVDEIKFAVQKRLAMDEAGPGYIRLPNHLPVEYFRGLASEELIQRSVRGASQYVYKKIVKENEPLDCLGYAWAISHMPGLQTPATPAKPGPTYAESMAKLRTHNT